MGIFFRPLPVFADLRAEQLESLKPLIEAVHYDAGDFVIQQNLPAEHLYIVVEGRVQISYKPYDGAPITVSHVEPGGLFGWSAVIGSARYTSTAIAIESLEAARIRGDMLRKLIAENPETGRDILTCLANAVSTRWKDAHTQVKSILENGMK